MSEPTSHKLCAENLDNQPIAQFKRWLEDAEQAKLPHANAMTLATVNNDGQPSARIVLLRGLDERGFCFYTNYESDKGHQLAAVPKAAVVFFWPQMGRQVRIEGHVELVSADESDQYFATRPRGHQLSAHASQQSRVIEKRELLEEQQQRVEEQYSGKEVVRPNHWGGYRLVPEIVEFWQEGEHRLHDRLRYKRDSDENWIIERLYP